MFLDWVRESMELVLGGPDTPFGERLLRGSLLACVLFVSVHWLSLWGTRWGDRHRVAKSFALSLLLHVCLCLGWATVIESYGVAAVSRAAAPSPPIPVTFLDEGASRSVENSSDSQPLWQRPLDAPSSLPMRSQQQRTIENAEVPRLEAPQLARELADEQPSSAPATEVPAAPQQVEMQQVPSTQSALETSSNIDEVTVDAREEAKPGAPLQRTSPRKTDRAASSSDDDLPRNTAAREAPSPAASTPPAIAPSVAGDADLSERKDDAAREELSPRLRRTRIPVVRATPAPVKEPEQPISTTGALRGVVRDWETGRAVAGTTIRFDREGKKPLTATTDAQGRYELSLPDTPDSFAVTASHGDYLPEAKNLRSQEVRGKTHRLDFDLRQPTESVIPLEDEPEVHHLGNDRFQGTANSQFQRRSEGQEREFRFTLTADQLRRRFPDAAITFMAKGIQCAPRLTINGQLIDSASKLSPADGAYSALELPFDARWLRTGNNTLKVRATDCSGDLDDFEFVNVQIRLTKASAKPANE